MIAKFYKGPWHNKRQEVRNDADIINVAMNLPKNYRADAYYDDTLIIQYGSYIRTKHTHPDGAVFYVWRPPS